MPVCLERAAENLAADLECEPHVFLEDGESN